MTVAINRDLEQKLFKYTNPDGITESVRLVVIQNNLEYIGVNPKDFLEKVWAFLTDYYRWADENIDQSDLGRNN